MVNEMKNVGRYLFAVTAVFLLTCHQETFAFAPRLSIPRGIAAVGGASSRHHDCFYYLNSRRCSSCRTTIPPNSQTLLFAVSEDEQELSPSSQAIVGVAGTLAAIIVFVSEFTLKTTGCGLPAGPGGIFGLLEGFSYLGVTGLAAYSLVTKVKTGSGLPAGPGGLLGAAEGLSFLSIVVGLVVLGLQITDYGYIPNAVPMEGGMCS